MAAQALLWEDPVQLSSAGDVGGLSHYFNEKAQALYCEGDAMATRIMTTPEGQYSVPGDTVTVEDGVAINALRLDHPAFGILFASWVADGALTVALYVYAADISDIIQACEITEQVDNPIKGLRMTVGNARADLFEHDMSLFSPGAAVTLDLAMGDSEPYPMGRYSLDTAPWDPLATTQAIQGRSRIARLLRDVTFDLYDSTSQAVFTGTPEEIVVAIIVRASDGELTEDDIIVQADAGSYAATFDPNTGVLAGLTDWLATFRTPSGGSYDTLEYGDSGTLVELAQTLLNNNMAPGSVLLVVDGIFGSKTLAAVKAFQRAKSLTATGDVDTPTWTALLGTQPEAWLLEELYDGRIIVGDAAFIAQYRPVGRYTFTRELDVFTRAIERSSISGIYRRVGIKYKDGEDDAYVFANVGTWPAWAVPSHRTYYMDAPEGATAAQAQALANKTAVELQYVGVREQLVGPIRPELLRGDISQISDDGGETATVTGLVTEVRHRMGITGYFTDFSTDSGGAIMEIPLDVEEPTETVTVTTARKAAGTNRKTRLTDVVETIAVKKREKQTGVYLA